GIALFFCAVAGGFFYFAMSLVVISDCIYCFVVHLHLFFIGTFVFGFVGMIYYMFPLITGRMYSEKLANIHFIGMLWGSVQVFYTQHLLGLEGMPRRIYDYPAEYTSWTQLNQIATIGAWILGASFVAFLINLIYYSAKGKEANMDDPFGLGGKYYYPHTA